MVAVGTRAASSDELGLATVAHVSRYRSVSRQHTESDLRQFFAWCQDRQLAPLSARRRDLELYLGWMQDVRPFKPSTVSRRLSVVVGFYRTCVIDGVLEHSPADYVRRPRVRPESPTLGLRICNSKRCSPLLGCRRTRSTSPWFVCSGCWTADLRDGRCRHRRSRRRARPPSAPSPGQGGQGRPCPATPCRQPSRRAGVRRSHAGAAPSQQASHSDGPPRRHPAAASFGPHHRDQPSAHAPAHAPAHLRHDHARRWR